MVKSIGFYDYAWSPVTGCLNGCEYCYGIYDFKRRGLSYEPEFHPDVLYEPFYEKKPSKIFVTHYTDLMGEFIPDEWVNSILEVIKKCTKHEFIFITKNPAGYYQFEFPANCVLGVTIESRDQLYRSDIIVELHNRKMASIEPIQGSFEGVDFSQFELVVIGAMMNRKSIIKSEWINSVKHPNIYYKPNVRGLLK